jgi:multidrug efflux pump subunit AcrA (membrane-fusion protein)
VLEPLAVHARQAGAATGLEARAPMPGSVVALPVAVGDSVRAGDTLVIIESMKLEVALKADAAGPRGRDQLRASAAVSRKMLCWSCLPAKGAPDRCYGASIAGWIRHRLNIARTLRIIRSAGGGVSDAAARRPP